MAVSRNTFIGDVLKYLGHDLQMYPKKYPEVEFDADATYLFSSEPFPFAKHVEWIKQQNVSSAIINGENISWFGIRTLRFLEAFQSLHRSSFYLRLKQRLA